MKNAKTTDRTSCVTKMTLQSNAVHRRIHPKCEFDGQSSDSAGFEGTVPIRLSAPVSRARTLVRFLPRAGDDSWGGTGAQADDVRPGRKAAERRTRRVAMSLDLQPRGFSHLENGTAAYNSPWILSPGARWLDEVKFPPYDPADSNVLSFPGLSRCLRS